MQATHTIDVPSFINNQRFSAFQWLVLLLCFLVVAIDGFDTAAIGYIAPSLVQDWGIAKPALGPVMSASLFGLAAGAIFTGPLADKLGRKTILVLSVVFFGFWSLVTITASSVSSLVVLRFLTGLGLGAAMPNAVTLMSEFAPEQRRSILVNTMFCGFPLGASAGGFAAAWLIPHYGWHSVLLVGGILPIALALVLLAFLPESVRYLVAHNKPVAQIRRILSRISGQDLSQVEHFTITTEKAPDNKKHAVGLILSRGFLSGTLALWLTYFMGLLIFYLLTSWLPILLKDLGFSVAKSASIAALFSLGGGAGALLAGWLMDKINPHKVVASAYALTAILVYLVGQGSSHEGMLSILIFLAGTAMNGAQTSMPSLAAAFYPTQGRATGVSWMLGVGRFGGICGALIGGELLSLHMGFGQIFTALAVPAIVATLALLYKLWSENNRPDFARDDNSTSTSYH